MTPVNQASDTLRKKIWQALETIADPEVPVLSVVDLGVIRDVLVTNAAENKVTILLTPTYSGCPAIDMMKLQIRMALLQEGFSAITLQEVLSPAWTTDWMSESGRQKLKAYGIAPPHYSKPVCTPDLFQEEEAIQCPKCNSFQTRLVSQFGSTACKALYQCNACQEPFDYFKCH
jgi:ring-1,2-phenylacetyl-CoA epoxidase subunit PaaD